MMKKEEILKINVEQTKFHNVTSGARIYNLITKLWLIPRRRIYAILKDSGINQSIYSLREIWLGDLNGKKVLDLDVVMEM